MTAFASLLIIILGTGFAVIALIPLSTGASITLLLVLLAAIPLATMGSVWIGRGTYVTALKLEADHRRKFGLCVACGYNLRGNPDFCPRCSSGPASSPPDTAVSMKPIRPFRRAVLSALQVIAFPFLILLSVPHALQFLYTPVNVLLFVGCISMAVITGFSNYRSAEKAEVARRRRAGLCVACAYDLRGSGNRCPECGIAAK